MQKKKCNNWLVLAYECIFLELMYLLKTENIYKAKMLTVEE
jgi:hypothetical protein